MKKMLLPMFLLSVLTCACAQTKELTVIPAEVGYLSGSDQVHAVFYMPAKVKGPVPAIIVIHEWWGLNDWVKEQAQKFAEQGYATLAVDLYRGHVATDPNTAHELMRGVPHDRAIRDMRAAVAYLQMQKGIVDPKRIGAVGWCMGGGMAEALAESDPAIVAVAINYGPPSTEESELKAISPHVLGNYGALDQGISADSVREFERHLKALNKDVDIKLYPDAGHAFENPNNKTGYRAASAADAWQRMTAFFARTLQQK
jgi:carboxymethylenebutenolidase